MSKLNARDAIYLDLTGVEREYLISRRTLWAWIKEGKLSAFQPLRKTLIKRAELEALIERSRVNADLGKLVNDIISDIMK